MQKKTKPLPKKLNNIGTTNLAIAVIRAAMADGYKKNEWDFFDSPDYDFYAGLAYRNKEDYMSGAEAKELARKGETIKRSYRPRPYSIR